MERINFVIKGIERVLASMRLRVASPPNQALLENRLRVQRANIFAHIRIYMSDEMNRTMSERGFSQELPLSPAFWHIVANPCGCCSGGCLAFRKRKSSNSIFWANSETRVQEVPQFAGQNWLSPDAEYGAHHQVTSQLITGIDGEQLHALLHEEHSG